MPRAAKRRLMNKKTSGEMNYGSEEEDREWDSNDEDEIGQIPRNIRMMFEVENDSPQEAEAADRVEDPKVEPVKSDVVLGPTSLYDFKWQMLPSAPVAPQLRREKFVGISGPMIDPISDPYTAFVLIWDRSIMEHIAVQTNRYAQEYAAYHLEEGLMTPDSRIARWKDTNADELYVYFALLMAMGLLVKSSLADYWSSCHNNMFYTPAFAANMTLMRFQLLSRCLHFNDNFNIAPNLLSHSEAKLHKIKPIVDHLNSKFSSLYGLGQNIALDESLTQWKGWLGIKQYIPNKATVVGIKTYEVWDSRTGYLWRFECHDGSQHEVQQDVISGSIPNLVLRLLRGLEHRGHTIWMDNYYNSPSLARVLKSIGFDCVGTLRTNRQFVPEEISSLKKTDMIAGQIIGCTSGDVDVIVWKDHKSVAMISTYHGLAISDSKPTVSQDYNVCMGGVDKKDQMLSAYPMERKRSLVWYKKFFRRLLNVSVLNAYILYKATKNITHRDFRMNLVNDLLTRHQSQDLKPMEIIYSRGAPKLSVEVMSHFPVELPFMPAGSKSGRLRRTCALCKAKRTHFVCQACDVALCFDFSTERSSCYMRYHR